MRQDTPRGGALAMEVSTEIRCAIRPGARRTSVPKKTCAAKVNLRSGTARMVGVRGFASPAPASRKQMARNHSGNYVRASELCASSSANWGPMRISSSD
jgi:hypothetical protein